MKRSTPLRRRTPLRSRTRLRRRSCMKRVNPERRDRKRKRAYGPEERRAHVTDLPCVACGKRGEDIHQAHIENGGTGRKAGADTVVPLCSAHHRMLDDELGSVALFDEAFDTDLAAEAKRIDEEWRKVWIRSQ